MNFYSCIVLWDTCFMQRISPCNLGFLNMIGCRLNRLKDRFQGVYIDTAMGHFFPIVCSFGSLIFYVTEQLLLRSWHFIYLIHIQLFIIYMNSLYFSFLA